MPEDEQKEQAGFSKKYKGNWRDPRNKSANVPIEKSTSLFLTNLHPEVTYDMLFGSIVRAGPTGKVYICHIIQPEGDHSTAAARIVYFTREAAEKLMRLCNEGEVSVGGFLADAEWNRIKAVEQLNKSTQGSRVLLITGNSLFVNERSLRGFFGDMGITFQVEDVLNVSYTGYPPNQTKTMEWRFARLQGQAINIMAALRRDHPEVKVSYGADPCDDQIEDNNQDNRKAAKANPQGPACNNLSKTSKASTSRATYTARTGANRPVTTR